MTKRRALLGLGGALAAFLLPVLAGAQDIASFEKRITTKVLDNGLTLMVLERPGAPVFSFFTHADVGAAQEVPGITGIAHMFEHMAFKGTDRIGTTDYASEKGALEKVEKAYADWDAERRRIHPDAAKIAAAEKAFKDASAAADKFVVKNEFGEIVEREGGVGMNAFTNWDETGYHFSMPVNRLELWAYLESERFLHPVFREFYKERDVVQEERRMRTDSQPIGRLIEQFLAAAYTAHPYGTPVVGWMSDLQSFSATDAAAFYEKNYVPQNLIVTVAGDLRAKDVLPVLERYFGRLPKRPSPSPLRTVEPVQTSERVVNLFDQSQPVYIEGYHKPGATDPDDAAYNAIGDILSNGRVSRLYRALVRDKKIAAEAGGFNGFPGGKYPNMFLFFAFPNRESSNEAVRDAIRAEIDRLRNEDVTDDELRMVKTRAKANLLRRLGDNQGLAMQLGIYQSRFGDWRELFRSVDRIDKVTKADIRRVANATFVPGNRTVGMIVTEKPGAKK